MPILAVISPITITMSLRGSFFYIEKISIGPTVVDGHLAFQSTKAQRRKRQNSGTHHLSSLGIKMSSLCRWNFRSNWIMQAFRGPLMPLLRSLSAFHKPIIRHFRQPKVVTVYSAPIRSADDVSLAIEFPNLQIACPQISIPFFAFYKHEIVSGYSHTPTPKGLTISSRGRGNTALQITSSHHFGHTGPQGRGHLFFKRI